MHSKLLGSCEAHPEQDLIQEGCIQCTEETCRQRAVEFDCDKTRCKLIRDKACTFKGDVTLLWYTMKIYSTIVSSAYVEMSP